MPHAAMLALDNRTDEEFFCYLLRRDTANQTEIQALLNAFPQLKLLIANIAGYSPEQAAANLGRRPATYSNNMRTFSDILALYLIGEKDPIAVLRYLDTMLKSVGIES